VFHLYTLSSHQLLPFLLCFSISCSFFSYYPLPLYPPLPFLFHTFFFYPFPFKPEQPESWN
jgi:hypothetical protein